MKLRLAAAHGDRERSPPAAICTTDLLAVIFSPFFKSTPLDAFVDAFNAPGFP